MKKMRTLVVMHNVAKALADLRRFDESVKLLEETLALQREKLPPGHPHTIQSMYSLANRGPAVDSRGNAILDWQGKKVPSLPGAPIPIAASEIQLDEFKKLNDANLEFSRNINAAKAANAKDPNNVSGAFFVPDSGSPDFGDSITSFLCTDGALKIFEDGGGKLDTLMLDSGSRDWKFPGRPDNKDILTNQECLQRAKDFYAYADIEGYRGSPHKL